MMNDDCTLLNAIRQTTEMGTDGIDAVLPYTSGEFRQALKQQRTEYQKIHDSADTLLHKLGGEPEDVSIGGTPAKLYYYTCDIFGTGKIIDPLPPVSNGYFYLYCYDKGGKQKAVVLLTSATPENAIISLGNLIEERTKIS